MVEGVESIGELGYIVGVVDGKGVKAGVFCQGDVSGVVHVWGWVLDHVVGEDHGRGRPLGDMFVSAGVVVQVSET